MSNHNVETCIKKKEQTTVVAIEVAQQNQKPQKTSSYACHIYGLNGHKMTNCPKFIEMQKMFHGKFAIVIEVQAITETQTIIIDVDVNVITKSKATKEHVFKDRKPRKLKSDADWEKKEWLNK
jgi:hypothetical protein